MNKLTWLLWGVCIALACTGFTCSKTTPREMERMERERDDLDQRTDKIKRLSRGLENFGLHKYEDSEVVCYIARQTESVALQCFKKGVN